jgi:hypothetical protein
MPEPSYIIDIHLHVESDATIMATVKRVEEALAASGLVEKVDYTLRHARPARLPERPQQPDVASPKQIGYLRSLFPEVQRAARYYSMSGMSGSEVDLTAWLVEMVPRIMSENPKPTKSRVSSLIDSVQEALCEYKFAVAWKEPTAPDDKST